MIHKNKIKNSLFNNIKNKIFSSGYNTENDFLEKLCDAVADTIYKTLTEDAEIVLSNEIINKINSHIHTTSTGPTTPSTPPIIDPSNQKHGSIK